MGRWHTEVPGLAVARFMGFAAQAKLALLESAGASALHIHTLPFGLNPGVATQVQAVCV